MFPQAPSKGQTTKEWLAANDLRENLGRPLENPSLIHHSSWSKNSGSYLASVLFPASLLSEQVRREFESWNFDPLQSGWGWATGWSNGVPEYSLVAPYDHAHLRVLRNAEPLLTRRVNSCVIGTPSYYEPSQKLTQLHDLHFIQGRSAYCTVDEHGDIVEALKLEGSEGNRTITLMRDILTRHLALGEWALVRFFDLTRSKVEDSFDGDAQHDAEIEWRGPNFWARWLPVGEKDAEPLWINVRGYQIFVGPTDAAARAAILDPEEPTEYCTFLAADWKHRRVADLSCDPKTLGNYFVESDLPFETTPAFFRREVLLRYQADTDKYAVEDRQISCRSSWVLEYGINDAGQVSAYLCDLSHLPYREQLYWKSFNESPKTGLSKSVIATDFEARWDPDPEPLRDLKHLMSVFPLTSVRGNDVEVWRRPSDAVLVSRVQYMASESQSEWESKVGALQQFIIEGLNVDHLKTLAAVADIDTKDLGSIRLLELVLEARGTDRKRIDEITSPLKEVQSLRSRVASHRKGADAKDIVQGIENSHRNLAEHFRALIRRVFEAMIRLRVLVEEGVLRVD